MIGTPYHDEYKTFLEPMAKALRDAAALSADAAFANFLRLRADALLSDDYYKSDLAWLDLKDPKFDVIFAPYETYLDDLLGVKTSYGASILIRNEEESRKLAVYQQYVPDIQDALPLDAAGPAVEARPPHADGGDGRAVTAPAICATATRRWPTICPTIRAFTRRRARRRSSSRTSWTRACKYVILPVAQRLMPAAQAAKASGEGYLAGTLLHEICHGLGPAFSRRNGKQIDIREAIGPAFSGLEEAKADVVGMFGLKWLVDHDALPKERLEEYYASYVAGIFRTLRFGTGEAHGRAEMMEFNYLLGNRRPVAQRRQVYASTTRGCRRPSRGWRRCCSISKRAAIALGRRVGSPNTTGCRRI